MNPVCFYIGSRPIYWYGVMVACAFLACVVQWNLMARREGREQGFGSELGFWIMVSGIVGARLAYVLANWGDFADHPLDLVRIDKGGLIFYGGFIGASLGLILFARARKVRLWTLADFTVCALPLGHAIGRTGCFINGCCYGAETSVPWATTLEGIPRHPVQLYESALNFALFFLLAWFYPRKKREGSVLALYLVTYPVGRFLLEFLRGDARLRWFGLNVAQEISLGLFAAGLILWFSMKRKAE